MKTCPNCLYTCAEMNWLKTGGFCPKCDTGDSILIAKCDKTKMVKRGA